MVAAATRSAGAIQLRGARATVSRCRRGASRAFVDAAPTSRYVSAFCNARDLHTNIAIYIQLPVVDVETPGSAPRLVATVAEIVVPAGADFCIPCVATDHPPPHYTYTKLSYLINTKRLSILY